MEKELTLTAYEGDKPYIFVSYAHKNSDEVLPVIAAMQSAGYRVWYDQGIEAGSEWPEYIEDHLIGCKAVLIFMSEYVVESANCRNEINLAHSLKKDLLVINLEPTQLRRGLALQLGTVQSIPLYEISDENALMDEIYAVSLLDACGENLKKPTAPRTKTVTHGLVKRKNRKNTVIAAALVALLLIVGIIAGVALSKNSAVPDSAEIFDYRHTSHGIEITGIKESDPSKIVIPDKIDGVPVTSICDAAFKGYDRVESVSLGKNLTNIGERAFENCDGLTEIELPDTLTSIGASAFADCDGLTKIVVPDSVQTIGSLAFSSCAKLTDVAVGKNVTSIEIDTFLETPIESASIPSTAIPCIATESLVSLTINGGEEINSIDWQKCWFTLKSLTICDGIKKINDYAFYSLSALESLSLPSTLTHIGSNAFPSSAIKKLTIPGSVEFIGESAFAGCTELTELTFEGGVTNVGSFAFSGCTALESITIPASAGYWGGSTFSGCTNLKSATLCDGAERICEAMFADCSSLEYIYIPNTVKEISWFAFQGCKNLKSIIIPDSVEEIYNNAFEGCENLSEVQLSSNLKTLGSRAFEGCWSLISITIPNSLRKLEKYTFMHCTSLGEINIRHGIKEIEEGAFWNCSSLESIVIPESVTSIGKDAFDHCTSLVSLYLPLSLTSISYDAIDYRKDLTVYCKAEAKPSDWHIGWANQNTVVWGYDGEFPGENN